MACARAASCACVRVRCSVHGRIRKAFHIKVRRLLHVSEFQPGNEWRGRDPRDFDAAVSFANFLQVRFTFGSSSLAAPPAPPQAPERAHAPQPPQPGYSVPSLAARAAWQSFFIYETVQQLANLAAPARESGLDSYPDSDLRPDTRGTAHTPKRLIRPSRHALPHDRRRAPGPVRA